MPSKHADRCKILLVEDSPELLRMLKRMLASEGYSVQTATTRDKALEYFMAERFHVAIIDVRLNQHDPYNYEGVCTLHSDTAFNSARITLTSGTSAVQCFAGANPCQVQDPGQPNNSVIYTFQTPVTDSGELNVRSATTYWPAFGPLNSAFSTDGGATYTDGPSFTPP